MDVNECLDIARETLDIEVEGIVAVKKALDENFARAVEILGSCKGRVIVTGIGKSGLVGKKLAATMSSTGTAAFFMHPVEGQHGDLGLIRSDDAVIAISNSGKTVELNAILPLIRNMGIKIISLTGGINSPMAELSDVVINTFVPREACPLNLAPTTSTTAVLAVGDALAVALIRYKNFTEKDFRMVHPGGALGQRLRLPISDIMQRDKLPVLSASVICCEAVKGLNAGGLGILLLTDQAGRVAGLLTDGDLRRAICNGKYQPEAQVSTIMTSSFTKASLNMKASEVLEIMEEKCITALPVLSESSELLGVVHMHDVLGKGSVKIS